LGTLSKGNIHMSWQAVEGLRDFWQAQRTRHGVPLRSLAFKLADGRLAVWSAIKGLGADAHRELAALGRPDLLVAPNHFHNLGLDEYARAYPGTTAVAAAAAVPRVRRKCKGDVRDEARLRPALPLHVSLLIPPATTTGELWLSVRGEQRAWIVGDGFFNIARTPFSPMGLILRSLGTSPGLRIGRAYRWFIRDRAAYQGWLMGKIAQERPTMLIPCHGDVLVDAALPDRLMKLAETLTTPAAVAGGAVTGAE
jgi:hypothetical protein